MAARIDLTGKKFARLYIIGKSEKRDLSGNVYWKCKCDCGKIIDVQGRKLRNGHTKSCGCLRKEQLEKCSKEKFKDMTGERYGNLTVIKRGEDYICGKNLHTTTWICRCDCGNEIRATRTMLINGRTKSCGCKSPRFKEIHGECKTRLYHIRTSMIQRCENKNHVHYENYGGRGINVCEEWRNSYENFRSWAMENGYKEDLTIDRIDVNGNYEPSNCKWATPKEQGKNRRDNHFLTFNGETHTVTEWAEIIGIKSDTLFYRIKAGWDIEDALTPSTHRRNKIGK